MHNGNFGLPASEAPDLCRAVRRRSPGRPGALRAVSGCRARHRRADRHRDPGELARRQHPLAAHRRPAHHRRARPLAAGWSASPSTSPTARTSSSGRSSLMDELNHRVRNTLAIVMAIANQTLRHSSSAAQFRSDLRGAGHGAVGGAQPAHREQLGGRGAARHRRERAQALRRSGRARCTTRRRSHPGRTEIRGVAADGVPRARHQRREIRRAVQRHRPRRGGYGARRAAQGAGARHRMARDRRAAGQAAAAARLRLAADRRAVRRNQRQRRPQVRARPAWSARIEVPLPPDGEGISRQT